MTSNHKLCTTIHQSLHAPGRWTREGLEWAVSRFDPFQGRDLVSDWLNVTLHHEMSCNVPNGYFHVFIISESKLYAIYNGENHFQIRGLVAELHAFDHGGTTFGTFEKTCFKY